MTLGGRIITTLDDNLVGISDCLVPISKAGYRVTGTTGDQHNNIGIFSAAATFSLELPRAISDLGVNLTSSTGVDCVIAAKDHGAKGLSKKHDVRVGLRTLAHINLTP
jgi:hypothetical protein